MMNLPNVARIWSIVRLMKRAAPLINLSIMQHLTNCAIFGQSLAIGLGLGLWLRLRNWPNVQHVWSKWT